MPLYVYVVTYKGMSYINQAEGSNVRGFPNWIAAIPKELQNAVDPSDNAFEASPNQPNVWRKVISIDGIDLVIRAIETIEVDRDPARLYRTWIPQDRCF